MYTWISKNFPILNAKWEELVEILENSSVMDRIEPCSGIWADKEQLEFVSVDMQVAPTLLERIYVQWISVIVNGTNQKKELQNKNFVMVVGWLSKKKPKGLGLMMTT